MYPQTVSVLKSTCLEVLKEGKTHITNKRFVVSDAGPYTAPCKIRRRAKSHIRKTPVFNLIRVSKSPFFELNSFRSEEFNFD